MALQDIEASVEGEVALFIKEVQRYRQNHPVHVASAKLGTSSSDSSFGGRANIEPKALQIMMDECVERIDASLERFPSSTRLHQARQELIAFCARDYLKTKHIGKLIDGLVHHSVSTRSKDPVGTMIALLDASNVSAQPTSSDARRATPFEMAKERRASNSVNSRPPVSTSIRL